MRQTFETWMEPSPIGRSLLAGTDGPRARRDVRPRVLIIEDDQLIADMYRMQLGLDGLEVVLAHDGETGLEMLKGSEYDVVLLDVGLPGIDGLAVLTHLNRDSHRAPVLVLSNYGDPRMIARAQELGATSYLIKSQTTPRELSLRVWAVVGGPFQD